MAQEVHPLQRSVDLATLAGKASLDLLRHLTVGAVVALARLAMTLMGLLLQAVETAVSL